MSRDRPDITLVLLTFNGERYLEEVLSAIGKQSTSKSWEIIAIDSRSTDGTVEILQRHQVRLEHRLRVEVIPKEEFGHARTRNLGARLARGNLLVFLTQDATPADEKWLASLVAAAESHPAVAGAYSRQLPRAGCNPCERRDIEAGAPHERRVTHVNLADPVDAARFQRNIRRLILFSNVSSCIRREVWERLPFDESLDMMEDQEWCKRALEAGHAIVYEPASCVYHSHNFSLAQLFERYQDYGKAYRKITGWTLNLPRAVVYALREGAKDGAYIFRQRRDFLWKLRRALAAPAIRFAMRYGLYRGMRSG
ncbi:MAG: glycosyltransferase [Planctomycetota bacterium]